MTSAFSHFLNFCLPACHDYEKAEADLSKASANAKTESDWSEAGLNAVRQAFIASVAIEGLYERAMEDYQIKSKLKLMNVIGAYAKFPGGANRPDSVQRVSSVANAYKHAKLNAPHHVIERSNQVLSAGSGYGIDGFGVGKFSGIEVLINTNDGKVRKFMGDLPCVMRGWARFFFDKGLVPSDNSVSVCNCALLD
jgi:hypothetical protein